jgi:hypothetical protein
VKFPHGMQWKKGRGKGEGRLHTGLFDCVCLGCVGVGFGESVAYIVPAFVDCSGYFPTSRYTIFQEMELPDHLRSSLFVSLWVSEQIDFSCRKWMERSRLNGSSARVSFGMRSSRIKKANVFHHRIQELQDPA